MVGLYALTLFTSALLLFFVQPMVGKMVLPKLGGTPAVWNTCMVFFQAMLLAGYAYAHAVGAWLSPRRQTLVHLLLLASPLAVLPIAVAVQANPPSAEGPVGWLLWQLLIGVGLPFFVLSSSAPLLQKWFTRTGHPSAADPYFLYAASNTGSLLSLLGYPLLVEPYLRLNRQSEIWAGGYVLLALLVAICAVALWKSSSRATISSLDTNRTDDPTPSAPQTRPNYRERLWWILLSFIPSSLMLGVTTYVTTEVAAIPLIWVLPLAIYLLSFILVFARRQRVSHALMVKLMPMFLLPMAMLFGTRPGRAEWLIIGLHLFTFFLVAMVCHGELARRRPAAAHLTEFYLLMSVGGVLGGMFNALAAPFIFSRVLEYPIVATLACFALPRKTGSTTTTWWWAELRAPACLAMVVGIALVILHVTGADRAGQTPLIVFVILLFACFTMRHSPVEFGLSYAVMVVALTLLTEAQAGNTLHAERNFFGVKRVILRPDKHWRMLAHGTTIHGCQKFDPAHPDAPAEPSSYYHRTGPIGDVFATLHERTQPCRVGVIGLGVGSLAAYAEPGDRFTFYEIDPAVERLARDRRYFSFLDECRGTCDVVLGDGRLTLAHVPDASMDLLILDAFSSDSIPAHLLAREALQLYLSKLAPHGTLVFHISNRCFDLEILLARSAEEMNLPSLARFDHVVDPAQADAGKLPSRYFVMARRPQDLQTLAVRTGWHVPTSQANVQAWTDQYSDVLGLFLAGKHISLSPRSAFAGQ